MYRIILKIIDKFDSVKIDASKKVEAIIFITTSIFYLKLGFNGNFILSMILIYYLITASVIDYKTMFVYSSFNYVLVSIAMGAIIFNYNQIGIENMFGVVSFIILNIILAVFNSYGNGDMEIYIIIACFYGIVIENNVLEILLFNMIVANVLMLIFNIKLFDIQKFALKKRVAFVPYISVSTIIFLLI